MHLFNQVASYWCGYYVFASVRTRSPEIYTIDICLCEIVFIARSTRRQSSKWLNVRQTLFYRAGCTNRGTFRERWVSIFFCCDRVWFQLWKMFDLQSTDHVFPPSICKYNSARPASESGQILELLRLLLLTTSYYSIRICLPALNNSLICVCSSFEGLRREQISSLNFNEPFSCPQYLIFSSGKPTNSSTIITEPTNILRSTWHVIHKLF